MISPQRVIELPGGARVLFTERSDGNLSRVAGTDADGGAAARERLREQIGVAALARGYQVHGTVVRIVSEPPTSAAPRPGGEQADGQATSLYGVGVMVLAADCLPVALAGEDGVAMIHAGWRGLAAGVLEEGVRSLRRLIGAGPIHAVLGPCACACCYEVGEEVHGAFAGAHRNGRMLDMRAIARDRLLAASVADVREVQACTICDPRFFSHRREGARAGRQAGVAWLS
ncbi:MAG: purine-nucleoside/S-methyl-5-thioadenosine phosphorylase / adenosine deaminase [Solirubrobacteraceae bacterium]|nr:purine-nucleoside/S-methyl-5-thioadenosine phosphorylase / adenosine deaminase [Solirubrobacteraceae bacterium]